METALAMLRNLLLYLSTQKQLRSWVETASLAGRLTKRFVAGQTLEEGLRVCRALNEEGILVTLDHLGEGVTSPEQAEGSRDAYLESLRRIRQESLQSTISLKLSQLGLEIDDRLCRRNLEPVVKLAKELGTRVEIDMESSPFVDRTLAIARDMHARFGCVRAVLQAYLYRTEADALVLCAEGVPVRLCKGAYKEPPQVAFPRKRDVNANFVRLSALLLERGKDPAIATHDPKMIRAAREQATRLKLSPDRFEFQMLYGIRRDLQQKLTADGCRLRLYVPYGVAWYPYFMRRLAERPANLIFLLRNLFRR
jgi:proline dehydrogenase